MEMASWIKLGNRHVACNIYNLWSTPEVIAKNQCAIPAIAILDKKFFDLSQVDRSTLKLSEWAKITTRLSKSVPAFHNSFSWWI